MNLSLIDNPLTPYFLDYEQQFIDYIRDPSPDKLTESLPSKAAIYARLLYSKFDGSLTACFPITRAFLGDESWRQLVRTFIREHRCQSPLYREIPDEFIDFLIKSKPKLDLLELITDLAHFEWMELVLETATGLPESYRFEEAGDVLEDIPVLNPVLHLLRYRYPVQTLTIDNIETWRQEETHHQPDNEQPIILAGLRDSNYCIHFITMNTVTARLIELLQDGFRTGRTALIQLAVELHYPSPENIIPFGEDILNQLVSQQIIIGVKHEI
jgi:uncharacterized protein